MVPEWFSYLRRVCVFTWPPSATQRKTLVARTLTFPSSSEVAFHNCPRSSIKNVKIQYLHTLWWWTWGGMKGTAVRGREVFQSRQTCRLESDYYAPMPLWSNYATHTTSHLIKWPHEIILRWHTEITLIAPWKINSVESAWKTYPLPFYLSSFFLPSTKMWYPEV